MPRLKGFHQPCEITAYAVWAYHRFALSMDGIERKLAQRSVIGNLQAVRSWSIALGGNLQIASTEITPSKQ